MLVVIDANELISLLIKGSEKSEFILFADEIELIAPEFLFIEFSKHKNEILLKTHRTDADFSRLLSIFERRVRLIPKEEFREFIQEAESLSGKTRRLRFLMRR